jgi:prolyl-tRNA synthetase
VAGSASPIGLKNIKVVVDDSVAPGINFVAGGNKPDTHIKNVNYPRDFKADVVADIARVKAGEACLRCRGKLLATHGIEVGHVFKLGTFLSEALDAYFIDEKGASRPIIMGCYGIGLGRLLAAAIEYGHDDKRVAEVAEKLYRDLEAGGWEVLFDDREESPGVKFNDADLLGVPLRVTVSPRTLEKDSVEVKWRAEKESQLVPLAEAAAKLEELVAEKIRVKD